MLNIFHIYMSCVTSGKFPAQYRAVVCAVEKEKMTRVALLARSIFVYMRVLWTCLAQNTRRAFFLACAFELCYNSRCRRARIILPTSVRRLVMLGEDGGRERGRSAVPIFHYRIRPFKWVLISSPTHKSHTGEIKIMRAIQNLLQVTRAAAC